MVTLICFLRRRPGMTVAEFRSYWYDVHAPLVAHSRSGSHVLRYEQRLPVGPAAGGGHPAEVDGVTVQWFASRQEFQASLAEPDYAEIAADLPNFLDVAELSWVVTGEPRVVIAGESDVRLDSPPGG
ncbi:MAG: EthD domain-containing protein [Mycobacteriales bacterium]